jgi:hypothetical protein
MMLRGNDMPRDASVIFLAGPPGAGKSILGQRVCAELGLRFVDLGERAARGTIAPRQALDQVLAEQSADVVELCWEFQLDRGALKTCRRAGTLAALWAHPQDMQARSGRVEPLFTPAIGRLSTHSGFGRLGTSCLEYRRLNRACEVVLDLVGLGEDEAAQELRELIVELRHRSSDAPAAAQRLEQWGRYWIDEFHAIPGAADVLLDAMARYLQHLERQGASPRTIMGICDDLQALGFLTFCYDTPKAANVLESLSADAYAYARKFTDSSSAVARYEKTVAKFRRFLAAQGLVEPDEEE